MPCTDQTFQYGSYEQIFQELCNNISCVLPFNVVGVVVVGGGVVGVGVVDVGGAVVAVVTVNKKYINRTFTRPKSMRFYFIQKFRNKHTEMFMLYIRTIWC